MNFKRLFFRCLLPGVLAAGILPVGGSLYLRANPELVHNIVTKAVNESIQGGTFSAKSIFPSLWPQPNLNLTEVLLKMPDGTACYTANAKISIGWLQFLRGSIVPDEISLTRPAAIIRLPGKNSEYTAQPKKWFEKAANLQVNITNGSLALYETNAKTTGKGTTLDGALLKASGLSCEARLPGKLRPGRLKLSAEKIDLNVPDKNKTSKIPRHLRAVSLLLDGLRTASSSSPLPLLPSSIRLAAASDDEAYQGIQAGFQLYADDDALRGTLEVKGKIQPNHLLTPETAENEPKIPLSLTLPFSAPLPEDWPCLPQRASISNGTLCFGPDSLTLNAAWQKGSEVRGKASIARLSLARWFGFARNLPNGLAAALNNLSGKFNFILTPKGLEVPEITVAASGITLHGEGGVRDFSAPVIALSLSAPNIDFNHILPELAEKNVPSPHYDGPILTFGNKNTKFSLGYDIRIQAQKANFWKFTAGDLALNIEQGAAAARLIVKSPRFYSGSFRQDFEFSSPCRIDLDLKNTSLPDLTRAFGKESLILGTLSAKAAITVPLGPLEQLLKKMDGKIQAELTQGTFLTGGSNIPFKKAGFNFSGKSISSADNDLPHIAQWNGQWTCYLAADTASLGPLDLVLKAKGALGLSTENALPVQCNALAAELSGSVQSLPLRFTGKIGFSVPERICSVTPFSGTAGELAVKGNLSGKMEGSGWQVQGGVSGTNLRSFLIRLGQIPASLSSKALRTATLTGSVSKKDGSLHIALDKGNIDATSIRGDITRRAAEPWNADIQLGQLDVNLYLPSGSHAKKSASFSIPTDWMYSVRAKGFVRAKSVTLANVPQTDVTIPFTLGNGIFSASPITSTFLGGSQRINFSMRAQNKKDQGNGVNTAFDYSLHNASMETLTKLTSSNAILRGTCQLSASAKGTVRTTAHLLSGLDGTWNYTMGKGAFIQTDKKGKNTRQKYVISGIKASGMLHRGTITCENLTISGPRIAIRGKGTINPEQNRINYQLTASVPNFPDIPVSYTGKLSDPTRNINVLQIFTDVLGHIGKNIFSFIGDVIATPFRLFN